ncbi:MAG: type II toxin-antitoxin system VapC family toxin [Chloroflexi bacterium]|nr:type II toxin-antitoxin system VapC family toxin [Chloroflexota bacterium]
MSYLFLDTSALLKLYLSELGSTWLQSFAQSRRVVVSELAFYESATAIRRRYAEGAFTQAEAYTLYVRIRRDRHLYEVVGMGGELQLDRLIAITFNLPPNMRLRALDGIHLTAAELALDFANNLIPPEPFVFVSSDRQLLQVAQVRGFIIENPEDHP